MEKNVLKKEDLGEETFWHVTSILNMEGIDKFGLVPHDGKRNGKIKSKEDPVARVFFSQGLEGILEQANNLAYLMNSFIKEIPRTTNGDNGENIKGKIQEFINSKNKNSKNGGFIDIAYFIKEDVFRNGINENLTEQELNTITYNIVKTFWENEICLKVNLEEGIDYSWEDFNYNSKGTKKVPMTKKNMHAFEGKTITSDKIEIITDENGQPRTTWDIFKEMAMFYKKGHPEKQYLPVEEWQSAVKDENGKIVYTGEINHYEDYLSMFIEMENNSLIPIGNVQNATSDITIREVNDAVHEAVYASKIKIEQDRDNL